MRTDHEGWDSFQSLPGFVHSPKVTMQLEVLAAAVNSKRAVLLEGPSASGKSSLVR